MLVDGVRINAEFEGAPESDGLFRATIIGKRSGVFRLRILDPRSAPARAIAEHFPSPNPLKELPSLDDVTQAFVRSGLSLGESRLETVRRMLAGRSGLDLRSRARLLAILDEKGLLDAPTVRQAIVESLFGKDSRDDTSGDRPRDGDARHEEASEKSRIDSPVHTVHADHSPVADAQEALQLFNHRRGAHGHWVILPLDPPEEMGFAAALAIHHMDGRETRWTPSTDSAYLHVWRGEERVVFRLRQQDERLSIEQIAGGELSEDAEFQSWLTNAGATFTASTTDGVSNDGFSDEDGPVIIGQLDERA